MRPHEADDLAALWIASCGISLMIRRSPSGAAAYEVLENVDGHDLPRAIACARLALSPMEEGELRLLVATLASVTARRTQSEQSDALAVGAWLSTLSRYPADAVRSALLPERWVFWPALAEVVALCKEVSAARFGRLEALERLARMSGQERGERWRERALGAERDEEAARARGDGKRAAQCRVWAEKAAAQARALGVETRFGDRARVAALMAAYMAKRIKPEDAS